MDVCCENCVLPGRGLCDELITLPEESYRLWCVVVCDLRSSWMRRPCPGGGCSAKNKQNKLPYYNYFFYFFILPQCHQIAVANGWETEQFPKSIGMHGRRRKVFFPCLDSNRDFSLVQPRAQYNSNVQFYEHYRRLSFHKRRAADPVSSQWSGRMNIHGTVAARFKFDSRYTVFGALSLQHFYVYNDA